MSIAEEARLRRFHRQGPWLLVGLAVGLVVVIEAVRRHVVSELDLLYLLVLLPSIVLHEVSHGAVAYACGDPTAKDAGRLTLNPLKHIDLFGTILLPILLLVTVGRSFGWAKPVPVAVNRLRHPRNQAVLVGLAGPVVNIVLAIGFGFAFRFATNNGASLPFGSDVSNWGVGYQLLFLAGYANAIVAVFNLLPIPPLDGSAVLERLLPRSALPEYYRLRSFSMVIVLFLVLLDPNVLNAVFNWALNVWEDIVFR